MNVSGGGLAREMLNRTQRRRKVKVKVKVAGRRLLPRPAASKVLKRMNASVESAY